MNRINQYGPYGSSVFTKTGTNEDNTPQYRQDITLSPDQQKLLDLQNQAGQQMGGIANSQLDRLNSALSTPIDFSNAPQQVTQLNTQGLPALPNGQISNHANDLQSVQDALMSRINPQLDQDRAKLEARLASQGIGIGADAYKNAMSLQGQKENDARMAAIVGAGQEQSRLIGNDAQTQQLAAQMRAQGLSEQQVQAALQNSARQQSIQEATTLRNQPLNEISALMSGSQVQNPNFTPVPQAQIQPADITGPTALAYQGQLAQYNAANASRNSGLGGLFGLGGSIAGALPWSSWLG